MQHGGLNEVLSSSHPGTGTNATNASICSKHFNDLGFVCNFQWICNASARQTQYQQVSGGLHIVSRSTLEGHVAAELAGMQALQEEALLLQHWSAVKVVQLVGHPHNVLPAPQHPCSCNAIACKLNHTLPSVLDLLFCNVPVGCVKCM